MNPADVKRIIDRLGQLEDPSAKIISRSAKERLREYVAVEAQYQLRAKLESLFPSIKELLQSYAARGVSVKLQDMVVNEITRRIPLWITMLEDKEFVESGNKRTYEDVNKQTEKYKAILKAANADSLKPLEIIKQLAEFLQPNQPDLKHIRESRMKGMVEEFVDERQRKFLSSDFFIAANYPFNESPYFDKINDIVELERQYYPLSLIAILDLKEMEDIEQLEIQPLKKEKAAAFDANWPPLPPLSIKPKT